jgi:hypothetical protein
MFLTAKKTYQKCLAIELLGKEDKTSFEAFVFTLLPSAFQQTQKRRLEKFFFENKQKKKKKNSLKAAMSVSFHTQQRLEIKLKKNQAKINPVKTFVGC